MIIRYLKACAENKELKISICFNCLCSRMSLWYSNTMFLNIRAAWLYICLRLAENLLRIKPLSFVLPTTTIINNTPYHSQVGCYLYENDMGVFSEVVVVGYHELAETKSHRMVHCTCHMHFNVLRLLFE